MLQLVWIGFFGSFIFPFLKFLTDSEDNTSYNLKHMLYKVSEMRGKVNKYCHKKSVEYQIVFDYYIIAFLPPRAVVNKSQQELSCLQHWLKKIHIMYQYFLQLQGFLCNSILFYIIEIFVMFLDMKQYFYWLCTSPLWNNFYSDYISPCCCFSSSLFLLTL